MALSICIFAHNTQWRLPHCIGALDKAAAGADYRAHIMVNGATDQTLAVAKTFAAVDDRICTHYLPVADKANAWNDYVNHFADDGDAHIFLDGDIKPSDSAFLALRDALKRAPDAYGAAALPASGRSQHAWAARLLKHHYLSGNLYALSGDCVRLVRNRQIRLPFGAKGEDGLISYLLLTDLKGGADDTHKRRITVAENATFEFDSLQVNWRDVETYHRRLIRYSERHFQKKVLYRLLKQNGLAAMPNTIYDIYSPENMRGLSPRLSPVEFWYDVSMLRRLRAKYAAPSKTFFPLA